VAFAKENAFHVKTINQNKRDIEAIIQEHTGFHVKLECSQHHDEDFQKTLDHLKDASPGSVTEPAANDQQTVSEPDRQPDKPAQPDADEVDFMSIPMVKQIIEMFDGEVVDQMRAEDKQGDR
jgi:hypothetical protein